jgi:hypothetical protein
MVAWKNVFIHAQLSLAATMKLVCWMTRTTQFANAKIRTLGTHCPQAVKNHPFQIVQMTNNVIKWLHANQMFWAFWSVYLFVLNSHVHPTLFVLPQTTVAVVNVCPATLEIQMIAMDANQNNKISVSPMLSVLKTKNVSSMLDIWHVAHPVRM